MMNYVVRLKRNLTHEESEQSENDAHKKLVTAYQGLMSETSGALCDDSDESRALQKIHMAMRKVMAD